MSVKGVCYQSNLVDLDETAHWESHPTKSDSECTNVAAPRSMTVWRPVPQEVEGKVSGMEHDGENHALAFGSRPKCPVRARGNDRSFLAMDDVREVIVFVCACFDRERDSGVCFVSACLVFFWGQTWRGWGRNEGNPSRQ